MMENRGSEGQYGNSERSGSSEDNGIPQPRAKANLTAEEIEVLRQCNRDSFWYRCVPLGITFIATTQLLVSRGIWKPHPAFGSLFKNMGAGLAAFIIGKMSYQGRCREKILQLDNSALADSLRKSRSWTAGLPNQSTEEGSESREVYAGTLPSVPEHRKKRLAESDEGRMEFKGLDDNMRPSADRETYRKHVDTPAEQARLSYEELRSKNRREYDVRTQSKTSEKSTERSSETPTGQSTARDSSTNDRPGTFQPGVRRNKYGDVIDS